MLNCTILLDMCTHECLILQDHDGSHIKGLIINFLDYFFPSLLEIPGFLVEFITPIVKVTRKKQELSFFTMPEFERWKEENNGGREWKSKYYKVSFFNALHEFRGGQGGLIRLCTCIGIGYE